MNEQDAWMPEEIISQEEALLSYTLWAHEASGLEYRRGMLANKFDADITILDTDIVHCQVDEIQNTKVLATYSAGIRRFHDQ
jgi:predicted amidohydrolase YtcJ